MKNITKINFFLIKKQNSKYFLQIKNSLNKVYYFNIININYILDLTKHQISAQELLSDIVNSLVSGTDIYTNNKIKAYVSMVN